MLLGRDNDSTCVSDAVSELHSMFNFQTILDIALSVEKILKFYSNALTATNKNIEREVEF